MTGLAFLYFLAKIFFYQADTCTVTLMDCSRECTQSWVWLPPGASRASPTAGPTSLQLCSLLPTCTWYVSSTDAPNDPNALLMTETTTHVPNPLQGDGVLSEKKRCLKEGGHVIHPQTVSKSYFALQGLILLLLFLTTHDLEFTPRDRVIVFGCVLWGTTWLSCIFTFMVNYLYVHRPVREIVSDLARDTTAFLFILLCVYLVCECAFPQERPADERVFENGSVGCVRTKMANGISPQKEHEEEKEGAKEKEVPPLYTDITTPTPPTPGEALDVQENKDLV